MKTKKIKPGDLIPVPVKCYYCRKTINLTAQSENLITADHICMSETAKAKRFPKLDEELQKLRALQKAMIKS